MRFRIYSLLLFVILLYLLWCRWQVSAVRFFDIDEFSYMHWTAQVARGERMYTDFFSYFTPGFMWAFAPVFWIAGKSAAVFTVARAVSYLIFLGMLGGLGYLFGITRGWKWAILPAVILAFLPMPYDKFLEIRPDNLATLLAIIGVIGEIKGIKGKSGIKGRTEIWWLVSGLAYSASLFILVKTLSIVAVGGALALLSTWKDRKNIIYFLLGLFGPWILFFSGTILTGQFGAVWYSLTRLPFEVYKSAANFAMEAHLFFFPNVSFYGLETNGPITAGLITNHAFWILGVIIGTFRLVTPALTGDGKKENMFVELLIALSFFVLVFGYVKYFPAKHSQYLIPIAVFIAYYAADGLAVFFDWLARIGGFESLAVALFGFVYLLFTVTNSVNAPKLLSTNTLQLNDLSRLIQTVPQSSRVVDLEGRMVFWPEGYPVSSLSIDSTLSFVSRRPPALAQYLIQHPADYIWDGDSGRLGQLTLENVTYIHGNFTPVDGFSGRLLKRNK